jgi:regulator of sirC expression with transglutaminase-like and TPR domain
MNYFLCLSVTAGALYNSLDPLSLPQHLAFYELHPDTEEGQEALAHAWKLLGASETAPWPLPPLDVHALIALATRRPSDPPVTLPPAALDAIDALAAHFGNRALKGKNASSPDEVLALPPEEIDLGRALLLAQLARLEEVRQYEAVLDLMALQIAARLPPHPRPEEILYAINRFIFHDMHFRFPPHSLYAQEIDLYTFLPSVLDGRQGVCLGVSILYLCLAERLRLPLEIITPPGHIYVRYAGGKEVINVETTARGIHLPSDTYLGVHTRSLQKRTKKEVIGMAFVNQAAVAWSQERYEETVALYEKALPYLSQDPLLKLFMGLNYLFVGKTAKGKQLLKEIAGHIFEDAVCADSIPEDYLKGRVDVEGIKTVFARVDETRESILEKQQKLLCILQRHPQFRAGLLQLAVTYFQLGRRNEALEALQRYHAIDPLDATVEYYLAVLSLERMHYNQAWTHLRNAQTITAARGHFPKALQELAAELRVRAAPPCAR